MLPTKDVKTWVIIWRDKTKAQKNITESQAFILRDFLHDKSESFIDFRDEKGDFEEIIHKNEIQSIKKKDEMGGNAFGKVAICDYGTRHQIQEECECSKRFLGFGKYNRFKFFFLAQKYFPNIGYTKDITPQMQDFLLNIIKKDKGLS